MATLEDFRKQKCFQASKLGAPGFFERKKGFRVSVSDGQKVFEIDGFTDEKAPRYRLSVVYRNVEAPGEILRFPIRDVQGISCLQIKNVQEKKKPRGAYPYPKGYNGR